MRFKVDKKGNDQEPIQSNSTFFTDSYSLGIAYKESDWWHFVINEHFEIFKMAEKVANRSIKILYHGWVLWNIQDFATSNTAVKIEKPLE